MTSLNKVYYFIKIHILLKLNYFFKKKIELKIKIDDLLEAPENIEKLNENDLDDA